MKKRKKNSWISFLSILMMTVVLASTLFLPVAAQADTSPNLASLGRRKASSQGIRGIDVSKWQGRIRWDLVAQDDIEYAFIRATYGTKRDPFFFGNATDAHKNKINVGAYHFARFKNVSEMQREAEMFLAQLERVNITYPVVLDVEHTQGLSRKQLSSLCKQFMDIVAAEGYTVMLYSYQNFIRDYLDLSYFRDYDLWVAHYNKKPTYEHAIWQHSCTGTVSGINGHVDLNVSYRDFGKGSTTPKPNLRKVVIDKEQSNKIKTQLNQTYNAGISVEGSLDMKLINSSIASGLQAELNKLFEKQVPVNGKLTLQDLQRMTKLDYKKGYAPVLKLIQSKLFFLGFLKEVPTGTMDSETITAIEEYQDYYHLPITGKFDRDILQHMFGITTAF